MHIDYQITGPLVDPGISPTVEAILHDLPEWFGIESAVQQYIRDATVLPTWLATDGSRPVGFLTVKQHTEYAAEVWVTGVLREYHHFGIGRALLAAAEAWLRDRGIEYLQVKTLAPSDPDPNYARTRAFYLAVGFRPLEEMVELWGPENPCLILIKKILE